MATDCLTTVEGLKEARRVEVEVALRVLMVLAAVERGIKRARRGMEIIDGIQGRRRQRRPPSWTEISSLVKAAAGKFLSAFARKK